MQSLNLPNDISIYLDISTSCYISELKEALEIKSNKNKLESNNKENINSKKNVIYLDNKGKKLFNIKSNIIDINCLVDLILFNFANKIPDCNYFEYNQQPKYVTSIENYKVN